MTTRAPAVLKSKTVKIVSGHIFGKMFSLGRGGDEVAGKTRLWSYKWPTYQESEQCNLNLSLGLGYIMFLLDFL